MAITGKMSNGSLDARDDIRNNMRKRCDGPVDQQHRFSFGEMEDIFFLQPCSNQHKTVNQA
ncbi:hypothetical protein ASG79_14080 [Arthrobacter sp. Soil761]|nr:hypothetical protein ASG79_14080 [Arthrobacter sp. Soil761]